VIELRIKVTSAAGQDFCIVVRSNLMFSFLLATIRAILLIFSSILDYLMLDLRFFFALIEVSLIRSRQIFLSYVAIKLSLKKNSFKISDVFTIQSVSLNI